MLEALVSVWASLAPAVLVSLRNAAILGAVFTLASLVASACNQGAPWWRKPDLSTDICYIIAAPLVASYARVWLLTAGMILFFGLTDPAARETFFADGRGPLAHLPFWAQVVLFLLISDLVLYVTHRWFHTARLWRWHAVHHSSEHLEWVSANRFHPVDLVFHGVLADAVPLLLGIAPEVLVWLVPFNVLMSALVHANLDWTFGPFRYVLASPVFHRWHHTGPADGGERNFAATFPVFDLVFGTFHMPKGKLPEAYGVDDRSVPDGFLRQMIYPLRR